MIRFTTRSGAVYEVDTDNKLMRRASGPDSPYIDYDRHPDGPWEKYADWSGVDVGASTIFYREQGGAPVRFTTPVASFEEECPCE